MTGTSYKQAYCEKLQCNANVVESAANSLVWKASRRKVYNVDLVSAQKIGLSAFPNDKAVQHKTLAQMRVHHRFDPRSRSSFREGFSTVTIGFGREQEFVGMLA
jgi:hypothetical protein